MTEIPDTVTDNEVCPMVHSSISVTDNAVTDNEFSTHVDNSISVTRKPNPEYDRISKALKYGESCGKCGEPIAHLEPFIQTEQRYAYSGIFGSGVKWLPTVICLKCNPNLSDNVSSGWLTAGTCEVCGRFYYRRKSRRALHWFCCERCEWRYRAQIAAQHRKRNNGYRICEQCGNSFKARAGAVTCSPACRQKAYRRRH